MQAVRVTVIAVRSDATANRPSGPNTLLIVNFLFLACVEIGKDVIEPVIGGEKWIPRTGSTRIKKQDIRNFKIADVLENTVEVNCCAV